MLVRFQDGDSEVLIETDKITYITRRIRTEDFLNPFGERIRIEVVIHFTSGESYTFLGKNADTVWDYFMENYLWKAPEERG